VAFRANEAAAEGLASVLGYLVPRPRDVEEPERLRAKGLLLDIADSCGPVVDAYPSWHPLVCNHDERTPATRPGEDCGYRRLDHTRYFAHGFITCPYGDGQDILDSVAKLPPHPAAVITAEKLDVRLYNPMVTPILVRCEWERPLELEKTIPLSVAIALILEKEVPCWKWAQVAETWETMRPYLLGRPHGSRSSLFVSQGTGQAIKKIWDALIYTGIFGPIKV
jgi:hypothetical protein